LGAFAITVDNGLLGDVLQLCSRAEGRVNDRQFS
jgi:hypothetical protein